MLENYKNIMHKVTHCQNHLYYKVETIARVDHKLMMLSVSKVLEVSKDQKTVHLSSNITRRKRIQL